jgi:viroplasmin and RNaseH domain-containing protein
MPLQDEVSKEVAGKVIAISIRCGRLTGEKLAQALKTGSADLEKAKPKRQQQKTYRGKQSVKHLVAQNTAISNIEVTDHKNKAFDRTAQKYGIDYALKKDSSETPPRYIVFFKGRDVDVMTQAFKDFSAGLVKRQEKPSLRQQLTKQMRKARENKQRQREKVNTRERGAEL